MAKEKPAAEKAIEEFIGKLKSASGADLESVVLYGSAAGGEFHPEFSDVNLLCVLHETSFAALVKVASAVEWWARLRHPAPLFMTRQEIQRSADVFAIEFLDMKERHRVLYGDDPLAGLEIPLHYHCAQVEYELREKVILLRERLLLAVGKPGRLWDLLLQSLPAFTTLFRHALIALGETPPHSKHELVQALATRTGFDPNAVLQPLEVREGKANRKQMDAAGVFSRYLDAVQQVTAAVDTMLDSTGPGKQ
jgi:predicted nucleotidyltransferase